MTIFRCRQAFLDGSLRSSVDVHSRDGLITAITPSDQSPPGPGEAVEQLPGLVLPGFADAHSHVFHRALRGRTHDAGGTFWSWRQRMYELVDRLDPDSFARLARAAYVEMVCAGVTAVGEFHYLHHGPRGVHYADPNELGLAAVRAGADAGLVVTLLDVLYLAGGFGRELSPVQERFSDGTVLAWAQRVAGLPEAVRTGLAVHSVRAVPPVELSAVADVVADRPAEVLHVHLSEQPAENEDCLRATGFTPTELLARAGLVTDRTAAVHATHLTPRDIDILGLAGAFTVICPSTEADLADGLPAAGALSRAGTRLALGSDQHVITDPFAQARGLEWGERLATGTRGHFSAVQLIDVATRQSHAAIGSSAGVLAVGAPADLVAIDTGSARTAGSVGAQIMMSAAAPDVRVVVVGGTVQARDGVHLRWGDPGPLLEAAIEGVWAR